MRTGSTKMRYSRVFGSFLSVIGLFVVHAAGAAAQTAGARTVTGNLTIGAKTEPLGYVYAMSRRDTGNPKKEEVRIVLTNLPLSKEVASRLVTTAYSFREDNKARRWGIMLELRPPEKTMAHLMVFSPVGGTQLSGKLTSSPHQLTLTNYSPGRIAGKLTMTEATNFAFVTQSQGPETTYRFDATFDVPVHRLAPPRVLTGAAARTSAPMKAMVAFTRAAGKGHTTDMRPFLSATVLKSLETPEGKQRLTRFKASAAVIKRAQVIKVLLGLDSAAIELKPAKQDAEGGPTSTLVLEMVRENNQWKLDTWTVSEADGALP